MEDGGGAGSSGSEAGESTFVGSIEPEPLELPEILVVDDDPGNLAAIEVALGELGRRLVKASSGREALRLLLERDFALILLDVQMPGMDGFETARLVRERKRSRHVPIIFVTAHSQDDAAILQGYELGAVDFLFKPIVQEVLRAKAAVFVELQARTAEVRRQELRLRELERREHDRRLAVERKQWEADALREENRRKDEFLAVLAHELRNPLTPIATGLELVREYKIDHEGLERVRLAMARQVTHLVRLVDDLLDVSRISQGKITLKTERVDLARIVEQAVDGLRALIDELGHRLEVELCDDTVEVDGDPVRLVQILSNLLHNAARYTDRGGRIRVTCARDGHEAVIRVADNGRGIAPDMLERIFDIFVQERRGGTGLGLGLTLVHQLVGLHGGRVRAFSKGSGQGTELVVRLPLATGARATPTAEAAPEGATVSRRVVLVEDDTDIREASASLLETWGHEVVEAADGREGIERILAVRPDIALVDIAMPGLDGYAVARRVRAELGPRAPKLVALTGFGRDEDRRRSHAAGFDEHIVKPAMPEDLKRVLAPAEPAGPATTEATAATTIERSSRDAEDRPDEEDGAEADLPAAHTPARHDRS